MSVRISAAAALSCGMTPPSRLASALMIFGLSGLLLGALLKLNHFMGAEPVFNGAASLLIFGLIVWGIQVLLKAKS